MIVRASLLVHRRLINSLLASTFRWLDTTPTSRIITRCTHDIGSVDGDIPQCTEWMIMISNMMIVYLAAVCIFSPIFILGGLLLCAGGATIGHFYVKAQVAVKREMSVSSAPVLAVFGSVMTGLGKLFAIELSFDAEAHLTTSFGSCLWCGREVPKRVHASARPRYLRPASFRYTQQMDRHSLANPRRHFRLRTRRLSRVWIEASNTFRSRVLSEHGDWVQLADSLPCHNIQRAGRLILLSSSHLYRRCLHDVELLVAAISLERIKHYLFAEKEAPPTERGEAPAYWPASGTLSVEKLSARYSQVCSAAQ
jgi:hypothetical protein